MMTFKEILDEVNGLRERLAEITDLLENVETSGERIKLIDEMIQISKRHSELDTLNKQLLLNTLKNGQSLN